ncbi:MAG: plasmid pRiA4b ORF-3 family protein [Candidatus Odinarchaeota archaeon]
MDSEKLFIFRKKDVPRHIYQLKITLKNISPPVWRRILISNYSTFSELHQAIQDCFYWSNYHLHEFSYRYPEPPHWQIHMQAISPDESYYPEDRSDYYDIREDELRLCDVFSIKLKNVNYLYDFGDNWEHSIRLEKVFPDDKDFRFFLCVGGKRATPPEDCGGSYGYQELLEIFDNPSHQEHEEMKGWVGEEINPEIIKSPMSKMTLKEIERKYGPKLDDEIKKNRY